MEGDFRIGEWLIQPQLNRIVGSDEEAHVEPKVMDVLVYLAQHSDEVLPKERIIQAVWNDTFVTDDALKYAIVALRKAFADDAKDPQVIQTIPRRGYRLIASVSKELEASSARYRIEEKIGEGAMGEVYLAEDTLLKRKVALKFLRKELEQDETDRKRLLREAQAAAALDHPYICKIYDTGELEGKTFIAMEYIQGQTLKEKLAQGALPLEEALKTATEIAEALEKAHEKRIVHRDLKPSSIMLTPEGHIKMVDFGLAKQLTPVEGASQEETLTKLTEDVTAGTLAYMSPEQLRGDEVDTRSDIFSFGIVLYEMLTGIDPFKKPEPMETASAILKEDPPPLSRYMDEVPSLLQYTARKMLAKEAEGRFHHMADVRIGIDEVLAEPKMVSAFEVTPALEPVRWRRSIPWAVAAVLALSAGLAIWPLTGPVARPVTKFVIVPPAAAPLARSEGSDLVISPDGRHIVYVAEREEGTQLYVRPLDEVEARPIPGTWGAQGSPFFSPDAEWVGFFTDGELKKVPLRGGAPMTLCNSTSWWGGGSWNSEDTVVFSAGTKRAHAIIELGSQSLYRVSAAGGEPALLASPDPEKGERRYTNPRFLPGGKAVFFVVFNEDNDPQIRVLSLETGGQKIVVENGMKPYYAATGHLVYKWWSVEAVPFDLAKLKVTGDSHPVLEEVGVGDYSLSRDGTLVYVRYAPGADPNPERKLVWVDREGTESVVTKEGGQYGRGGISPDGKQIAVRVGGENRDVWIYDLETDSFRRLTFEGKINDDPLWTPDGKWITFQSYRDDQLVLYRKLADGSRPAERLTTNQFAQSPFSWSPDGSVLAFRQRRPEDEFDIWMLQMDAEAKPQPFIASPALETAPVFSPDGRWLAYVSDETGRGQVYVCPYPQPDVKWLVSGTEGGTEPLWSPDGTELFYRSENKMMVVPIETKSTFKAGTPQLLFERSYHAVPRNRSYDISPDGQRFLMIKKSEPQAPESAQIRVVLNWFGELKRLVPAE